MPRSTLQLFKLLILDENPDAISGAAPELREAYARRDPWIDDLIHKLRSLAPKDRDRILDLLNSMIGALPKGANLHYGKGGEE